MNGLVLASSTGRPPQRPAGARQGAAAPRARRRLHVLVADEKGMIRDAICALLAGTTDIARVSSVNTGPETLRSNVSLHPDVIILEMPRPIESGAKLIAALKRETPDTRVIVLTFHREEHLVDAALRAGADAYVLKKDGRDELFAALESVVAGKTWVSPALRSVLTREAKPTSSGISPRERQVMRLIAEGHRTREIAQLLSLSYKTVEKHRTSIMRKLGLRNASAVAAYAMAHGYADD